jgi:hypothetical protein
MWAAINNRSDPSKNIALAAGVDHVSPGGVRRDPVTRIL